MKQFSALRLFCAVLLCSLFLTLAGPGSADRWCFCPDDQSAWKRVNVTKDGDGLYFFGQDDGATVEEADAADRGYHS